MRRNVYAALAAVVLIACGDPAGSSVNQQGLLRFNYTGPVTGSYLAEASAQDTTGTGAYALARTNPVGYEIDSRGALQTPPVVRVRIVTDQRGTGVYQVQPICDVGDGRRCAHVRIEFPNDPATGARRQYLLVAGTLTITSANARRIRGTFSGTSQANVTGAFQVQNGEFDLPVLSP
jgi:hypothetical protein